MGCHHCHPSGLVPPKAGDNGDVNGLPVSPPSQTLQAFFSVEGQKVVLQSNETLYLPFLTVIPWPNSIICLLWSWKPFTDAFNHIFLIFSPILPYLHRCGAQDLSDRHGIDASAFGTCWCGMAWGLPYSSHIAGQDAPDALPLPPLPEKARMTGWLSKTIDVNRLTSAVLETSVATGCHHCHPSGLVPPKAGDNSDVNGLPVSPPPQTLQAVSFCCFSEKFLLRVPSNERLQIYRCHIICLPALRLLLHHLFFLYSFSIIIFNIFKAFIITTLTTTSIRVVIIVIIIIIITIIIIIIIITSVSISFSFGINILHLQIRTDVGERMCASTTAELQV